MKTMRTIRVLMAGFVLAAASTAGAQTTPVGNPSSMPLDGKLFVNVNIGAQTQSSTLTHDFSFPLYRETASFATSATADGGALFDVSAGYRFRPSFAIAVGFSSFSSTGTAQGTASIPNPVFFNRPAPVTIDQTEVERTERNTSILLVWFLPLSDKMEASLFAGPSFTRATQGFITNATVPSGTQDVVTTVDSQSGTATGVNIGADLAYMFLRQVGAGFFLRYNGGSFDVDTAEDIRAGGFQLGVGARLLF